MLAPSIDGQFHRIAFKVGPFGDLFPTGGRGFPYHILQRNLILFCEVDGIHLWIPFQIIDIDLCRVIKGCGLFYIGGNGGVCRNRFHMREFCAVAQVGDGVCVFIQREIGQGASIHLDAVECLGDNRLLCLCHFLFDRVCLAGDRTHSIGKRVLLVGIDLVLFQHSWAAASIANAGLHVIQRQIDLIGAGQLIGMGFAVQFRSGIVQGAEFHGNIG